MATNVTTLKNADKTDNLVPRTEIKAIFDSDGNYLDSGLKASDLNPLKDGAVDELVRFTEDGAGTPIPTDADTLEGHDASYFATASEVASLKTYDETVINSNVKIRSFGGALKQIILSDASSDANGLVCTLPTSLKPTADLNQNTIVRGASQTFYLVRIYPNGEVYLMGLGGTPKPNVSSIVGVVIYS